MKGVAYSKIYRVVGRIPPGRVMTYGGVARAAGLPGRARQVGYALHALPEGREDVPWQRVVNARGRITLPNWEGAGALQHALLQAEGVTFDQSGRIDLSEYGWSGSSSSE